MFRRYAQVMQSRNASWFCLFIYYFYYDNCSIMWRITYEGVIVFFFILFFFFFRNKFFISPLVFFYARNSYSVPLRDCTASWVCRPWAGCIADLTIFEENVFLVCIFFFPPFFKFYTRTHVLNLVVVNARTLLQH